MFRTIFILICSLALSAAWAAASPDLYELNLKVNYVGDDVEHVGTGMILIPEGDFAQLNVMVFENGSLRLSTSQSGARSGSGSAHQSKVMIDDELLTMLDFSLSPRAGKGGDVLISGTLEVMTRVRGKDKPGFEFVTEPVEFVVKEGSSYALGIESGTGMTMVEIKARELSGSRGSQSKRNESAPTLLFDTEYSLRNEDASGYEVRDHGCLLGSEGDYTEGRKHCSWYTYYPTGDKDSLLYWMSYNIDDIHWINDVEFDVTIDFSRTYAINPDAFDPNAKEVTFKNATISLFSKEVRTRLGEVLDIILDDAPEGLPFKGRETVRLISRKGK